MTPCTRLPITAAVAAALALVAAGPGPEPQDPSAGTTVVRRCLVEFDRNTTVSPTLFGLLKECLVEPGARVKAGQVLGRLQDDDVRAEVRLRELEAASDVEVRLGEAKSAQATNKMQRTASLVLRNAASKEEYHLHQLEAAAGALEVEQARHKRRLAEVQLEHSRAVLKARELVSPHDGVVVTVGRRQGETVAPRDPVFQVVDTDRLRVVGLVDVAEVGRLRVGQAARVIPEVAGADLPVEHQVFPARLTFIDSQIDIATRTCKVHVVAENRDGLLRAGLEARVEFDPEPPPAAPVDTDGGAAMNTNTTDPAPGGARAAGLTAGGLLARNAAGNLLSQCVPMAVAIVSIPWLIRGLGTDRYGVMTLSWMVLGYFSLFDLGLGRALTKMVAEALGRGEEAAVPGLVWTALGLMTALGVVGAAFVAAVTPWLVGSALKITGPLRAESLGAFYLMAAALPVVIGTSGLRGVLEAHQTLGAANVVRSATALAILLGPLAVLPFTTNLVAVVGVVCLVRGASFAAHAALCLRTVPGLRRGFAAQPGRVGPMLRFGGWMTAVNVINPLMVQMDRFLVGGLVSTAAVAYYTTPYELITRTWFLSNAVLGVMFPAFATSYVRDRGLTAAIFGRCLRVVALILFPAALVGVGLGREVLTVWLGADFAGQSARVMQWLALGVLLNGLAQVPSALIQGVGRPDLTFKIHAAELPFYLLAAWLLIGARGIEGAAMAWAGRTAVDLALYLAVVRRVLPQAGPAVRGVWQGVAAAVVVLAAAALTPGTGPRAAVLVAAAAGFAAVAWSKLLTAPERAALVARLGTPGRRGAPAGRVRDGLEPVTTA